MRKKNKISIIGIGYVGLPLAIAFSKKYETVGFDLNKNRVNELKIGHDSFNDQLKNDITRSKNLKITFNERDILNSDYFIVTVPTPVDSKKKPNLKPLIKASKIVGKNIKKNSIIIYESTVYPGCTEEICVPILAKYSGFKFNKDFFCGYSPERINVGDKLHKLENIKKIVSGSNKKTLNKISKLYLEIIKAGVHKSESIKIAEAAKVIENTQRDLNIALVNELSVIFDKLNINTEKVIKAAGTKWNFVPYKPGLVGGHCVGVDPFYLTYKAKKIGYNPRVILSGRRINDSMSKFIFEKITKLTKINKINKNNKIIIMGYGFKENCSDTRNSKVIDLVNYFLKAKRNINIFDPLVNLKHVSKKHQNLFIKDLKNFKNYFDILILTVPHNIFIKNHKKIISNIMRKKNIIYDIKSALPPNIKKITL